MSRAMACPKSVGSGHVRDRRRRIMVIAMTVYIECNGLAHAVEVEADDGDDARPASDTAACGAGYVYAERRKRATPTCLACAALELAG